MSRAHPSEFSRFLEQLTETRKLLETRLDYVAGHAPEHLPALKHKIAKVCAMHKYTHRLVRNIDNFSYIGMWQDLWNVAMLWIACVRAKLPFRDGKPDLSAYLRDSGDI